MALSSDSHILCVLYTWIFFFFFSAAWRSVHALCLHTGEEAITPTSKWTEQLQQADMSFGKHHRHRCTLSPCADCSVYYRQILPSVGANFYNRTTSKFDGTSVIWLFPGRMSAHPSLYVQALEATSCVFSLCRVECEDAAVTIAHRAAASWVSALTPWLSVFECVGLWVWQSLTNITANVFLHCRLVWGHTETLKHDKYLQRVKVIYLESYIWIFKKYSISWESLLLHLILFSALHIYLRTSPFYPNSWNKNGLNSWPWINEPKKKSNTLKYYNDNKIFSALDIKIKLIRTIGFVSQYN